MHIVYKVWYRYTSSDQCSRNLYRFPSDHYVQSAGHSHSDLILNAVGEIVVCRFTVDNKWYRAKVIDTDPDISKTKVFYVDYGNTEWVEDSRVQPMEPQFMHLPFQAVECFLPLVPGSSDPEKKVQSWHQQARYVLDQSRV